MLKIFVQRFGGGVTSSSGNSNVIFFEKPCEKNIVWACQGSEFFACQNEKKTHFTSKNNEDFENFVSQQNEVIFPCPCLLLGVVYYNILPKNLHLRGINDFKVLKRYIMVQFQRGSSCGWNFSLRILLSSKEFEVFDDSFQISKVS